MHSNSRPGKTEVLQTLQSGYLGMTLTAWGFLSFFPLIAIVGFWTASLTFSWPVFLVHSTLTATSLFGLGALYLGAHALVTPEGAEILKRWRRRSGPFLAALGSMWIVAFSLSSGLLYEAATPV